MVDILVVSHSHDLAKSAVEFALEIKQNDFNLNYIGGIEIEDKFVFGTDPFYIKEIIEHTFTNKDILIIADLGSSILNVNVAISLLDEKITNHIKICPNPFLESLLIAVIYNEEETNIEQLLKQIETQTKINKL